MKLVGYLLLENPLKVKLKPSHLILVLSTVTQFKKKICKKSLKLKLAIKSFAWYQTERFSAKKNLYCYNILYYYFKINYFVSLITSFDYVYNNVRQHWNKSLYLKCIFKKFKSGELRISWLREKLCTNNLPYNKW